MTASSRRSPTPPVASCSVGPVLSGLKTLLETRETLTTPGSLLYAQAEDEVVFNVESANPDDRTWAWRVAPLARRPFLVLRLGHPGSHRRRSGGKERGHHPCSVFPFLYRLAGGWASAHRLRWRWPPAAPGTGWLAGDPCRPERSLTVSVERDRRGWSRQQLP